MRAQSNEAVQDAASEFKRAGRRQPSAAGIALAGILLAGLVACGRRPESTTDSTVSPGSSQNAGPQAQLFSVPQEQMAHVRVVPVETSDLPRVLRLTGTVAYNSFETTPVITQVGGPVSRILISPGQVVEKGQPLLFVSSPDYSQLRTNYLKARDAFELAEKNDARARDLYAHHAIAEADLLQADSARNQAQADLQAAEQSLKILGVPDLNRLVQTATTPEIPVLAPLAGVVVERLAGPGQVIQAGTTQVFTISNTRTVWVLVNVFERDLGSVHLGDSATIQTDAYAETFSGRISYMAPALDPTTRTLQVRIVTSNPGDKLKKDMYVTAIVHAGRIQSALLVSEAAVLRNSENQPFVYVGAGSNQFAQRLITIGDTVDGKTQVLAGLKPGEQVVADGSLFLQFANSLQR